MGSDSDSSWGSDRSAAKVKKPTRYKMAIGGVTAICGLLGLIFIIWGISSLTKTVEAGTCNCVSAKYNPGTCSTSSSPSTPSTPSPPSFSTTTSSPSTQKEMEDASRGRQADVAAPTRYPTRSPTTPRTPVRSPTPSPPACQQPSCEVTVLFSTGGNLRMQGVGSDIGDLPRSCPGNCTGQPQDFECWKSGDNAYSSESAAKGGGAVPLVLGLIFLFCASGWIAYFGYKLRKYNEKKAAKKEKKRLKQTQVNVEANPAPQITTQPYPQQPGQAPPQAYAPQGYAPQQVPNQPYPPQQQYAPPPQQYAPPPGYNPAQAGAPNTYQPIQPPPPGYQG